MPAVRARPAKRKATATLLPHVPAILARLAPDARAARTIAALEADLARRAQHGLAVNLDPASLILDMLLAIAGTADRIAAAYEVP